MSGTATVLDGAPWMWVDDHQGRNACAGFLRRLAWRTGDAATLHLVAESLWRLYVNGRFVAAGPAPFRKPVMHADSIDLAPWLRPGDNEVFILVRWFGEDTKWILADRPCLCARIDAAGMALLDAAGWQAWPLRLWSATTPRISWAREAVEDIDLGHPDAAVLARHAGEDYACGAAGDPPPARVPATGPPQAATIRSRRVPPLRWGEVRPLAPPAAYRCNGEVYLIQDLARRLLGERWAPAWDADLVDRAGAEGFRIDRRRGERGWALVYDLRRVCAGDLALELEAETPCTVDVGFSEMLAGDRPEVSRSGSHYVARLRLRPGLNRCRLLAFHGFRHVLLSCKDIEGGLTVRALRARECHADLPYADAFACPDRALEGIYGISRRSVVLNTQAACYDCNTREIGAYWGDGLWIADIAGHLSGDFSHLCQLARDAADEWAAVGVINASLHGMGGPLLDFCLVPAEVLHRAWRFTGDAAMARELLPAHAAIVEDIEAAADGDGWLRAERLRQRLRARRPEVGEALLFLDHAGLGWHPRDTTAIDRRDVNAGLQLFRLQALQALSQVARGIGAEDRWGARAERLRAEIPLRFADPATGLLADARPDDGLPAGSSQIVNALAVTTGALAGDAARRAMRRCIDQQRHPEIAGSTPYGHFFICDALCRLGMVDAAVRLLRERFVPMLDRGATTTWEAWGGELHDSLNHAWSAILPWLAYRGLAGLRPAEPGYRRIRLAPALDALDACELRFVLPQGPLQVAWKAGELRLALPAGVSAEVELPAGRIACAGSAVFPL